MYTQILLSILFSCSENNDTAKNDEVLAGNTFYCMDDCNDTQTVKMEQEEFQSYLQNGQLTEDSCTNLCQVKVGRRTDCCVPVQVTDTDYEVTCYFYDCYAEGRKHQNIKSLESIKANSYRTGWLLRAI